MAAPGVFIIAEIGSVHDGSIGNALALVDAAAASGADAVKFQTHIADAETLPSAPAPAYFSGEPRMAYFMRTAFSVEQWQRLKARCDDRGVTFLSSPFSEEAVDLLEQVGIERYKIPSGEVSNLPLLEKIGALRKPVLLSSGMSSWAEIDSAVSIVRRFHDDITVLNCTTEYPCPDERVGLNVMQEMRARYGLPVGLSDHTLSPYAAFAAVALGASVIEKHFTFSRLMYGSDAPHSLEPPEFLDMVRGIRAIERMLAHPVDKSDAAPFASMKEIFEKSIVARCDIAAGDLITRAALAFKKPGDGIPAAAAEEVVGRRAARPIAANTQVRWQDLQERT
jgi:N,N'-diacetyllegionaminate synthase